jgi:UDP-N-acetylglucosamine 2-epimerase
VKRNIAVFTGTRAEYGLLHWLMKDIQAESDLSLQVIVGAMHRLRLHADPPLPVIENLEHRMIFLTSSADLADMQS